MRQLRHVSSCDRRLQAVICAAVLACSLPAQADERSPKRVFDPSARLFTSAAEPTMRLTIPAEFRPLGRLEFALADSAWVDRHLFAVIDGTYIQKLIILQFEGFLDGVEGAYRFAVPPAEQAAGSNYRFSPSLIRLGASDWLHNTWAFDHRTSAEENPGRESDRTLGLLTELGLALDAELIMSRFVRAVGEEARRELILFYIEPLRASRHRLDEFPDGGPPSAVYDRLSAAVTERSLEIFRTLEDSESDQPPP